MAKKELHWSTCDFKIGAVKIDDIPPTNHNEIAFAGRSNVGKSSLINAVTGRNTLSRVSKTPGCTRQLNFFLLDESIYLVDMPGYGFAERGKKEIAGWNELISNYLTGRPNLRRIFLLIDSRHGLKPNDEEVMGILDQSAVSYQIVLTKIDKLTRDEQAKIIEDTEKKIKKHPAAHPQIRSTSAEGKLGIEELRKEISDLV